MSRLSRRRWTSRIAMLLSMVATAFGLVILAAILWTLLSRGVAAISPELFYLDTPPPGVAGGLANALYGSAVMTLVALAIAAPLGVMAGTALAEFSGRSRVAAAAGFLNDVLLSAPSIVIGLFVYTAMVVPMGHFSAWAGAVSLVIIALPVIVRTTQDMLQLVPGSLREAAVALGTPRWRVVVSVVWRAASNGLLTGILLAYARVAGETAPLLFTALSNQYWNSDMNAPMASLPVVIFQFAMSPYDDWQRLAWAGAFIITLTILVINIGARALGTSKHS
ncbi:phosphate ABC transporter permease PstA [Pleomorphomonas carboxyditropha]|uniref:Phosphate transport system permease protein PstA n=1 Tax=Pleomorphomonas carboxyditropha TaxID=2023338 RepID=A0A2G9WRD7_9HYPH|nr:phosphate ABC transporter permease PstA [Pleomorphomonas carboxyditropha]PIO97279.1 phosphate ABC transporter, permease protein PstA [Pleomorphomonas carboxyditropha]